MSEIEAEDWNCNIRRYVDNAPPPEPHDVRAHLHGGVPIAEIDALGRFWENYPGLRERVFAPKVPAVLPRLGTTHRVHAESPSLYGISGVRTPALYADFTRAVTERALEEIVKTDSGLADAHAGFLATLERWWSRNLPHVEALAPVDGKKGNVYELRRLLLDTISDAFADQRLLTDHQIRGALARYFEFFRPEFKSIAFSGWGPELSRTTTSSKASSPRSSPR